MVRKRSGAKAVREPMGTQIMLVVTITNVGRVCDEIVRPVFG